MTELWVERTGTRRYTGRSSRGAEVLIGAESVEGVFTPGELLKIALAACTGMSSDRPLARRLGDDYDATIHVSGDADRENEVYPRIEEILEIDLSELEPDAAARLLVVVERAIDAVLFSQALGILNRTRHRLGLWPAADLLTELHRVGQIISVNHNARALWAAIDDTARLRDALGVPAPLAADGLGVHQVGRAHDRLHPRVDRRELRVAVLVAVGLAPPERGAHAHRQ